jgi:hypothetical protein
MTDLEFVLCCIIIILLWDKYQKQPQRSGMINKKEGLQRRPTPEEVQQLTQQTISFKELFDQSQLAAAKRVMPWLDPVVYEDLRMLNSSGQFTAEQIEGIIAKS